MKLPIDTFFKQFLYFVIEQKRKKVIEMDKRKLDGAVNNILQINKFINSTPLYISCEKSRALLSALMADKIQVRFKIFKLAVDKILPVSVKVKHCLIHFQCWQTVL